MIVTAIGTGGAFAPIDRGQSNFLLTSKRGKHLLLDCGMTAPYKLEELGIKAQDIDAVYVSHQHADHIGGMEWAGFMTYFSRAKKPKLYCERNLMHDLWETSLRGGMKCLQGEDNQLSTYFDCQPVDMSGSGLFEWEGYVFQLVQTLHVVGGFSFNHSYGLMVSEIDDPENKTFFTTDTQFCYPCPLQRFYDMANVIFHDCETLVGFKSGVHAHFDDMAQQMDANTKKKTWLYHHGDVMDAKGAGFAGFVSTFDSFDLKTGKKVKGIEPISRLMYVPIELVSDVEKLIDNSKKEK